MRGYDYDQSGMFSYVMPEERVPADHPIRPLRVITDEILRGLSPKFQELYSNLGRPSVPPEKLLRALLLQMLFSIRSERMLMQQLDYNLLYRWFVGLSMDEPVWDVTVFSKNRERLEQGQIAQAFFAAVLERVDQAKLRSDEHFTVDGTLLEAWASVKSYQKKDVIPTQGSGSRGELLLRDTHQSKTDPEAQMYRKSKSSPFQLCHMGHVLMENRHGFAVACRVTTPSPEAERQSGAEMLKEVTRGRRKATVGADKLYDDATFVAAARDLKVTPHVAQYEGQRGSSIDARTTRHPGYTTSLQKRKTIEPIFGWIKNTAGLGKVKHRGSQRVGWMFTLALSVYNLVRLTKILA